MERLFDRFVAAWLAYALGSRYQVAAQVRTPVGAGAGVHFAIDVVVSDRLSGDGARPAWVIDTKYKLPDRGPDPADVAQILAYAQVQAAPEAVLVYPAPLRQPLDTWVNGIRLRTLAFPLGGDLDAAGAEFVRNFTAESQRTQ